MHIEREWSQAGANNDEIARAIATVERDIWTDPDGKPLKTRIRRYSDNDLGRIMELNREYPTLKLNASAKTSKSEVTVRKHSYPHPTRLLHSRSILQKAHSILVEMHLGQNSQ